MSESTRLISQETAVEISQVVRYADEQAVHYKAVGWRYSVQAAVLSAMLALLGGLIQISHLLPSTIVVVGLYILMGLVVLALGIIGWRWSAHQPHRLWKVSRTVFNALLAATNDHLMGYRTAAEVEQLLDSGKRDLFLHHMREWKLQGTELHPLLFMGEKLPEQVPVPLDRVVVMAGMTANYYQRAWLEMRKHRRQWLVVRWCGASLSALALVTGMTIPLTVLLAVGGVLEWYREHVGLARECDRLSEAYRGYMRAKDDYTRLKKAEQQGYDCEITPKTVMADIRRARDRATDGWSSLAEQLAGESGLLK